MSWGGYQGHPPPPQGYGPPPGQYQQPYPQQPQGQYGSHPMQPPYPNQAAPGQQPPLNMYQQPYGGYPPPHGGHSPHPPPQTHASPYPPPGGAPYGGPPGYPPQSQSPFPPQQGHSPYPSQAAAYASPQAAPGSADPNHEAEALRKAMQGWGSNKKELIRVFANIQNPEQMLRVQHAYHSMYQRDLLKDIGKETSGYFRETLEAIVRGPLHQDAHLVYEAVIGTGTNEPLLNDAVLGRSGSDIQALKSEYHRRYHRNIEKDVSDDLSFKTDRLFSMVLTARREPENAPVYPQMVHGEVEKLHHATEGRAGTDQITVCQVFTSWSDGQLRAIAQAYQQKYRHPLGAVIGHEFSHHMRDALLRILAVAEDRAKADAEALEAAMAGMGTKDRQLLNRLVRIHWDKQHLYQVKMAYRHFYHTDLVTRVKGETSGDYREILVALCG